MQRILFWLIALAAWVVFALPPLARAFQGGLFSALPYLLPVAAAGFLAPRRTRFLGTCIFGGGILLTVCLSHETWLPQDPLVLGPAFAAMLAAMLYLGHVPAAPSPGSQKSESEVLPQDEDETHKAPLSALSSFKMAAAEMPTWRFMLFHLTWFLGLALALTSKSIEGLLLFLVGWTMIMFTLGQTQIWPLLMHQAWIRHKQRLQIFVPPQIQRRQHVLAILGMLIWAAAATALLAWIR